MQRHASWACFADCANEVTLFFCKRLITSDSYSNRTCPRGIPYTMLLIQVTLFRGESQYVFGANGFVNRDHQVQVANVFTLLGRLLCVAFQVGLVCILLANVQLVHAEYYHLDPFQVIDVIKDHSDMRDYDVNIFGVDFNFSVDQDIQAAMGAQYNWFHHRLHAHWKEVFPNVCCFSPIAPTFMREGYASAIDHFFLSIPVEVLGISSLQFDVSSPTLQNASDHLPIMLHQKECRPARNTRISTRWCRHPEWRFHLQHLWRDVHNPEVRVALISKLIPEIMRKAVRTFDRASCQIVSHDKQLNLNFAPRVLRLWVAGSRVCRESAISLVAGSPIGNFLLVPASLRTS
eukprot:6490606-Amphidinium_carterae.5